MRAETKAAILKFGDSKVLLKLFPYEEHDSVRWDEFIAEAPMATFLHTRRFLSYHGDRFRDLSLLLVDGKNRLVGLFPAAVDPANGQRVISHPGITYGGLLHSGGLRGEKMFQALHALKNHYAERGFGVLRYKAVPYIYHQVPSSDDLYALFRLGAIRYRCDLSCAIDLLNRLEPSQQRKRGLKKALKNGIEMGEGPSFLGQLWEVLEENLARKHGTKPVHSLSEIARLHSLFPKNIEFVVGLLDSRVVAGVVLFLASRVVHAQYIASSTKGYEVCALDAIFEHCIRKAQGARYFGFGISNEDDGRNLNEGLYQFKASFGAGGVVHEFYELNLRS